MASIRAAAQKVLCEAREAIAWIALWREGRGWNTAAFWPDYNESTNTLTFSRDDIDDILEILEKDPDAIIVNGWIHNLGPADNDMTRDSLVEGLRWQYDLQHARLVDRLGVNYKQLAYTVYDAAGTVIGKTPILEQAVEAARRHAAKAGDYADVTQFINKPGLKRIRRCRYFPDGTVRQIWKEAEVSAS